MSNVVVTAYGGINVQVTPNVNNCVSQSGYGPNYISFLPTHPGLHLIKADLSLAMALDYKISIYLDDNKCTGRETRLWVQ